MPKVNRQTFRKLASVWSDDPAAARLIDNYSKAITRRAAHLDARWPGVDWEPICQEALYLAAYTYRPGKAGFCHWLSRNVFARATGHIRNRKARVARHRPVSISDVDSLLLARWDPMQPWELDGADTAARPA